MARKILAKWVMAPDGTMLPSFYDHDFRIHKTDDGRITNVDGGTNSTYSHTSNWDVTEMTVYEDDHFEVIRRFFCRLNVGEDGKKPYVWTPLFRMSDKWLSKVIDHEKSIKAYSTLYLYIEEQRYREENKITVDE